MNDIVGRIFAIIAAVLFMFFVPLTISMQSSDKITQRYVDNSLERFKDVCLTSGEITEENYQRLISDLGNTGYTFQITLEHHGNVEYADDSKNVQRYYLGHSNDEIVEQISTHISPSGEITKGTPYKMKQGDYLKINVVSTDATYGSKIANMLTFGALSRVNIYGRDSGMVRTNG